ncbi:MAG: CpaF family protein [Bacilli bacterium]
MNKTSLISAFNIEKKKSNSLENLSDYEIFKDKELLDNYRKKIIENLIDKVVPESKSLNDFINEEITNITIDSDLSNLERSYLYNLIDNEINGFGPITELLEDDQITQIMVNAPDEVFIEINGVISKDNSISFINEEHIMRVLQKLLKSVNKSIDVNNPMIDVRLDNGTRVNAIIPPISTGVVLTIRKNIHDINDIDDFIRTGSCTPYMARFLEASVLAKLNIIICGGASSGRTTLLGVLGNLIPDKERIVTIEQDRELNLQQENIVSLEAKDGGNINIRDLVVNSLRMRPDRILVGEVKGIEAFDILQAMNTGHNGMIATVYANGVYDVLKKIESMIIMNNSELPAKVAKEYISNAVDLVVNIEKMSDGKKKITSICELNGIENENIAIKEIFSFKQNGVTSKGEVDGEYILNTGSFCTVERIKEKGITDIDDIFENIKKSRNLSKMKS